MRKLAVAIVAAATLGWSLGMAVALATVVLEASADRQRGTDPTLDVRTIPFAVERADQGLGRECVPGTGSAFGVPPSTRVTLAPLDSAYFTVGDEIVFEVVVERLSDTPIALAITRDADLAPSCQMAEGDVRTSFSLVVRRGGVPTGVVAVGPTLYGSHAVAGTTLDLSRGERLRVRVPAKVMIDPKLTMFEEPQRVEVAAMMSVQEGAVLRALEMSPNSQAIQVARRY